jgi:hypothetical protein
MDQLQRVLQKDGWGNHAKNMRELKEALEAVGIEKFRHRDVDGRRPNRYRLPPCGGADELSPHDDPEEVPPDF